MSVNEQQEQALRRLCNGYSVAFDSREFGPRFDLPAGWVAGWVGPIYVGCSPEGEIHS